MNQINQCILEGNLVKNPEYKENIAGTGGNVSKFVLASNKMYKDSKGQIVHEVSYFDIEAWGNTAKKSLEAKVGQQMRVVGRMKQNRWKDEKGINHSKLFIVAEHIDLKEQKIEQAKAAKSTKDEDLGYGR